MDLRVDLRINGERRIAGKLKGYDQFMNIVLDEAIELVQNKKLEGKQELVKRNLGTIVVRGQSVCLWENIDKVE
jgi:small nuclear ribonucleoprotein G